MSEERELYTTNELISTSSNAGYRYSKAAGIKTGFTTPAGRCLISTASNDDLQFLGIIMGAATINNEDTGDWDQRSFPEFINMCEYFFERYQYTTISHHPLSRGGDPGESVPPAPRPWRWPRWRRFAVWSTVGL